MGSLVRENVRTHVDGPHGGNMDKISSLVANPVVSAIIEKLREGDLRFNKEVLLLARHMGLAQGDGNFRNMTAYTTDILLNLYIFSPLRQKRMGCR